MTFLKSRAVFAALALLASCVRGEHRDAREKFDDGVADLVKGDFDAAEKALLEARSAAGVDPELRFRAAYDLGMAYAAHADQAKSGKDADLQKGLELEEQAVSWFGDAGRLRPDDADTKANLAIARSREQAISDELRKGEGKLEARLDKLIGEQRKLLDDGRDAWLAIKSKGGADPLAQQSVLTHLADVERGIVAEAGVIGDLAADEIDAIGKKPDDKRTDEEKMRVVQLKNLDLYLLEARARIAEARRQLQELDAEAGVDRAEAAMIQLKRAREQLLDPITVLREVARDELAVMEDTAKSAAGHSTKLEMGAPAPKAGSGSAAADDVTPAWMLPKPMADRQGGLKDRVEEIRARLAAGVEHADAVAAGSGSAAGSAAPPAPVDPKQQKTLERVRAALPAITDATQAMDRAKQALTEARNADAEVAEREALLALGRAIEQFSDLKQTIELAHAEQQHVLQMLSPEAAKQLSGAERAKETQDAVTRNVTRVARLQELIADEVADLAQKQQQLDAKAAQVAAAPAPAAGSGSAGAGSAAPDPKAQLAAAKQQLDQAREQLTKAEQLRGEASTSLTELVGALAASKDPNPSAATTAAKLDELRKLFFSVIEHLQELARVQGETRDLTSTAITQDDATRAPTLPGLLERQGEHGAMAKAITDALAAQADAAAKAPAGAQAQQQPGQPSPQQQAKTFAAAADEVRQAQGDMTEAGTTLTKARDATNTSIDLKPAVDSQAKAIEHLEAALKLLQPPPPPKQDQNDKKDQKQDQQKQDQQKQDQAKQDQQPRQGGAGQRARDEDAKRQRERQKPQGGDDNVDKDW